MSNKNIYLACAISLLLLTAACGPSEEEIYAASTQNAANEFVTQTAIAPTVTSANLPTETATATRARPVTPAPSNRQIDDLTTLYPQ